MHWLAGTNEYTSEVREAFCPFGRSGARARPSYLPTMSGNDDDGYGDGNDIPELPKIRSHSILRPGSRTDLVSLDDSDDEAHYAPSRQQHQQQQQRREDKKRASFSQQGPERFEFTPGSAPGGSRVTNSEIHFESGPFVCCYPR